MRKIDHIEKHIDTLVEAVFISNRPDVPEQRDPACGLYAISYITKYYENGNPEYPYYPAKKHDCVPSAKHSLREMAKKKGVTKLGEIFDVAYFSTILADTAYTAEIKHFKTEQEMADILQSALQQKIPVIFPMDYIAGNISIDGHGKGAHYITLMGTYSLNGEIDYVAYSWKKYYEIKQTELFKSNQTLIETDDEYYFKKNGWYRENNGSVLKCLLPRVSLQGLHSKCVLIHKKPIAMLADLPFLYYVTPRFKQSSPQNKKIFTRFIEVAKSHSFLENETLILQYPGIIDNEDENGQNGLLWAASVGNFYAVKCHLFYGANMQARTKASVEYAGYSPLHWAAMRGHLDVVRLLLEKNARTDAFAGNLLQPIHVAAKYGQLEVLQLMLQRQPDDLNATDRLGQTPILWAAASGQLEVVKYLLSQGATLHSATQCTQYSGWCALEWAVSKGYDETVGLLLENEEDLTTARLKQIYVLAENHLKVTTLLDRYKENNAERYAEIMPVINHAVVMEEDAPCTQRPTTIEHAQIVYPPARNEHDPQRRKKNRFMHFFICGHKSKNKAQATFTFSKR